MAENTKTDNELMCDIDEILYAEHPQPYSKGDSLLMLIRGENRRAANSEVNQVLDRLKVRPLGALYPLDDSEREWNQKLEAERNQYPLDKQEKTQ